MIGIARKALWIYVAAGALTLLFQVYVRLPQCEAMPDGCAASFGKGIAWSLIWPAVWVAYLKGS